MAELFDKMSCLIWQALWYIELSILNELYDLTSFLFWRAPWYDELYDMTSCMILIPMRLWRAKRYDELYRYNTVWYKGSIPHAHLEILEPGVQLFWLLRCG